MKPPYSVPSMLDIAKVRPNGYRAASLFAGAGGSSLGYRLCGFKIVYASEFVPAARDVYEANAAPGTMIDGRDIRDVDPRAVLKSLKLKAGDLDVLDGSPPCASFSMAGNREADWSKSKKYSDTEQRTDDLFFEYVRFIKAMQPRVFVAENVSGLVKGTAKGVFLKVLAAMKACGYRVEAQLLDAQWLGVPQTRQRLIFIGVRNDLGLDPVFPKPLPYRYSVRDALPWIKRQGDNGPFGKGGMREALLPSPTIGAGPKSGNGRASPAFVEADSDISKYAIGREALRLSPGQQSDRYFSLVRAPLDAPSPTVTGGDGDSKFLSRAGVIHPTELRKFSIGELKRICAFPDDFILSGTYSQQWERLGRAVPPVMMRAIATEVLGVLRASSKRRRN